MSDHGWPDFSGDDAFDAADHDPGGDPLGGDQPVPEHDGDLFHDGLFHPGAETPGDDDGSGPAVADGWDDGDEPGHGTGAGDVPAAGYDDWHDALSDFHDSAADPDTSADGAGEVSDDTGHGMGPVGADPDAMADAGDPGDVFPPAVDVGPLPEPVDGFPWIDTGSLGVVPLDDEAGPDVSVSDGAGLAEYAAADLPPGVDPWAELAGSDDPATSTLARFWRPQQ